MRKVKVEQLTLEAFQPFGYFAKMINPKWEKLGKSPIEFYRDMLQVDMGGSTIASLSTLRIEKRPLVIDASEYHDSTAEGLLPLDNDILIHVAPATAESMGFPASKVRVFKVPAGTMVVLRPGVWHHAPFTVNNKPANILILLPERLYNTDCEALELDPSQKIAISLK